MTPVQKYVALVERLYDRTVSKKLSWALANGTPYVEIGNRSIFLSEGRDFNDEPLEIVTIKDVYGQIIESFDDLSFKDLKPKVETFLNFWQIMSSLRQMAHRQAIGADDALDEILFELSDDDDVPF